MGIRRKPNSNDPTEWIRLVICDATCQNQALLAKMGF